MPPGPKAAEKTKAPPTQTQGDVGPKAAEGGKKDVGPAVGWQAYVRSLVQTDGAGAGAAGGAPGGQGKADAAPNLDPRAFVEANPHLAEPKEKKKQEPEHSSRSDATSYESQPAALREVLERTWPENAFSEFRALSDEARSNLVHTYNRMIAYGIWDHVRSIKKLEAGEKPVSLGPIQLHVAGKSQSILFEVYDGKALRDTMLGSGKFGADEGAAGALHPGQTSMREWSTTTEDGLHLSIGLGTEADAHMDKKSPTTKPKRQKTQMELVKSLEHHWQEVWPEFLRAAPGWLVRVPQHVYNWLVDKSAAIGVGKAFRDALKAIPKAFFEAAAFAVGIADAVWAGTTFKPAEKVEHPDPSQREKGSDIVVVKEYRFGGKGKGAGKAKQVPKGQASMTAEWTSAVLGALASVKPASIIPAGRKAAGGDYADVSTTGEAMAGKILHQAKAGQVSIGLDLGDTYLRLSPAEAKDVKAQLTAIGKTTREALAEIVGKSDSDLASKILGVRSGLVQLGETLQNFAMH